MTAISVNPYFRSKSAKHDVTLTSFVVEYDILHFKILTQCVKLLGERVRTFGGDTCIGLEDIARKRKGGGGSK